MSAHPGALGWRGRHDGGTAGRGELSDAHGFARARCGQCGHDSFIAFSW